MPKKYQTFPGMDDILPADIAKWQHVEQKARTFFESRGFKEIRTPILEPTELFARSIGETSDIVHKEMYAFEDRGGRSMTLRPEMTASVARSVIQHGLLRSSNLLRLYYMGPMFRAERPQAGRKRQFHQIGAEMVNETGVQADFEMITALFGYLQYLGLKNIRLKLNDLTEVNGPNSDKIRGKIRDYFSEHKDQLDKDSLYRLDKNVLRIFDSKAKETQAVIEKAPWEEFAPLSDEFNTLKSMLEDEGIPVEVNRRLVRGLDYYTGVVFEVSAGGLGAQDAVAGGGRYDRLYNELGAGEVPCTGFSLGVERLFLALEHDKCEVVGKGAKRSVYLAPLEDSRDMDRVLKEQSLRLRESGIQIEMTPGQISLSTHLKKANKLDVGFVLILGPDEVKQGQCAIKDLNKREQKDMALEDVVSYLEGEVLS